MKKLKKLNLNVQLIAVFFAAVLLLSMGHFFLYSQLFRTLGQEEEIISAERMENVQMKLASTFNQGEKAALEILTSSGFQSHAGGKVDGNGLLAMEREAEEILETVEHAARWFVVVEGTDQLITSNGCCDPETFLGGLCVSEGYDWEFWQDRYTNTPGMHYYSAADFQCRGTRGKYETLNLMPMSFQSYYDRELMVVLMLDIGSICQEDTYLEQGAYFFSQEGELIFTTDDTPLVTQIPEGENITLAGETYTVKRHDVGGPVCVKLQKASAASNLLRSNFVLCLVVAVAALVAIAVLVPTIVKTLLTPVDRMVDLVRQHGEETYTDLQGVSRELEQIIQSREQQAADLAQKNAELSEYRLHARMKNVYVDMKNPEEAAQGKGYLLYIQTQYLDKALENFTIPRAELENCLQEMMGSTLEKLFATVVIFQTEQGRFAARVTLQEGQEKPKEALSRFMKRLEQESEFAAFTVVCSRRLVPGTELAAEYDAVRSGARLAKVGRGSQLITAGGKDKTAYLYPQTEAQRLDELVRQGKIPQAAALAERLIKQNVDVGISHAQMEILCVAMVNTAAYAAAAVDDGSQKIAAASGVYNALATGCLSPEDYMETVAAYIRTMEHKDQPVAADEEQLLGRIRQYLQENYHKEFSVEEMAAAMWVSRSYLSSYYKNKTGNNISDAIQNYRIEKAKELLRDPDVKIGDVGAMVGIPSPNTFLRQFRKYTDMTPKEYRLSQK